MNRLSSVATAAALSVVAVAAPGCNRNQATPQTQTTTGVQPRLESTTASGCLRAGLGENTYVLTAAEQPGRETATYELTASNVNLRDYVGQRVQVAGTLRSEEQVASSAADAVKKPATGTSGTPVVETKTELNVKQMTVNSVTPSGEQCAAEAPKGDQPERRIK